MNEERKPKFVDLSAPPENESDRLEKMIQLANLANQENNQNGNGKKNTSKEVRARRRAQKLARKKNKYN